MTAPIPGDGKVLDFQYRPRVVRASRSIEGGVIYTARGKRTAHKGDWVVIDQGKIWEVFTPKEFEALFEAPRPEGLAVTVTLDPRQFAAALADAMAEIPALHLPRRRLSWWRRCLRDHSALGGS